MTLILLFLVIPSETRDLLFSLRFESSSSRSLSRHSNRLARPNEGRFLAALGMTSEEEGFLGMTGLRLL